MPVTNNTIRALLEAAKREQLCESLSRQTFWDFYAVFSMGLDNDHIDTDGIVDRAWWGVFSGIVKAVWTRWGFPCAALAYGVDMSQAEFNDGDYSESWIRTLPEHVQSLFNAKTPSERLAVLRIAVANVDKVEQGYVDMITDLKGTWFQLAQKVLEEAKRAHQSKHAKALSVDRMLAWSHHSGPLAEYLAKWLPFALDMRSRADAKTLIAQASPEVRSALRSGQHGIGQSAGLTWYDRFIVFLHRHRGVSRVIELGEDAVGFTRATQTWNRSTSQFDYLPEFYLVRFDDDTLIDLVSARSFNRLNKTIQGNSRYEMSFSSILGQLEGIPNDPSAIREILRNTGFGERAF